MIRHQDKILPTQPRMCERYKGENYAQAVADLCQRFAPFYAAPHEPQDYELLSSPATVLSFLCMLIRIGGYRSVLEIGTLNGVSAIAFAKAGAVVITLEKGEEFYQLAKKNIEGIDDIQILLGDALYILPKFLGRYDFIFIDGGKEDYHIIAKLCERRLSKNGLMVIDDVFFDGDALNEIPATDKGAGCKAVLEHYAARSDFDKWLLPIGNGLLILRKH